MRQDNYAIGRQVHIRLDGMRSHLDGSLERSHGVLGPRDLGATVGDGLREETRRGALRGEGFCPGGFSFHISSVSEDSHDDHDKDQPRGTSPCLMSGCDSSMAVLFPRVMMKSSCGRD